MLSRASTIALLAMFGWGVSGGCGADRNQSPVLNSTKDRTADLPVDIQLAAGEATTLRQAREIINLGELNPHQSTQGLGNARTRVAYRSTAPISDVIIAHRTELDTLGWTEIAQDTSQEATSDAADVLFTKNGFYVLLRVHGAEDEAVMVTLTNLGNVDVRTLGCLPEAESVGDGTPARAQYSTTLDLGSSAAQCRQQLAQHGWQEYAAFGRPASSESSPLRFVQGSVLLLVSLDQLDAGTTLLTYQLNRLLPWDVPILAQAQNVQIDEVEPYARYESPASLRELVDFYRTYFTEFGRTESKAQSIVMGDAASLVFHGSDGIGFGVSIRSRADGGCYAEIRRL